ncbi:MAG: AI-2E family transporter [Elusimicrobia bacterium]|nr:AI-2E family transporter [Elusimicrobiota bacterium]
MSGAKKASYVLVPLGVMASAWMHLAPAALAGLLSYMVLDLTFRALARRLSARLSRWLALAVFLVAAAAMGWMVARFVRATIHTLPEIAATAIPRAVDLAGDYGVDLPFENVYELREVVIQEVRQNAEAVTKASGLLTLQAFQVLIAVFAAVLAFFCPVPEMRRPDLFDELGRELAQRMLTFMVGFEKLLGAQVLISAAYAVLTLAFLVALGFKHLIFLTLATFLFGIMPIIGNVISNAIIVASGLTLSDRHAFIALVFLIVIHKSGYFVYGKVLGERLQVPMWQTLLAILLGQVVMGVPGIVLAPTLLHYVKEELRAIPAGAGQDQPMSS